MKFFKKSIITFLVIGAVSLGYSQNVQACNKTPDCYATGEISKCGDIRLQVGCHKVTKPDGSYSYCTVSVLSGWHNIWCAGCGTFLRTEWRTCFERHSISHSHSRQNACK